MVVVDVIVVAVLSTHLLVLVTPWVLVLVLVVVLKGDIVELVVVKGCKSQKVMHEMLDNFVLVVQLGGK